MGDLVVGRVAENTLLKIGTISRKDLQHPTFSYHEGYLELEEALAISTSLPLRRDPFVEREFRPYFEGLLPEGPMRTELAARLAARDDDYLTLSTRLSPTQPKTSSAI